MTCDSRGNVDGINQIILTELAAEFVSQDVDFVLFPGDLTSGMRINADEFETLLRRWVAIMAPVYNAGIGVYVCRGNHEIFDNYRSYPPPTPLDPNETFAGRWLDVFGSDSEPNLIQPDNGPTGEKHMTFSFTHENAFVVMLDQYAGTGHWLSNKVNQPWLDAQLAGNTKPHLFIVSHQPAFKAKYREGLDKYPDKRNAFWQSIANNAGRVYFSGHDHFYNHSRADDGDGDPDNDVHQFIVGAAGPLYSWNGIYPGYTSGYSIESLFHARYQGYVIVEVNDLDVTLTWMQRSTTDLDVAGVYEPNDVWAYTAVPKPIVLSPNGDQTIAAQSPYAITWKTLEGTEVESVKIDYSTDNGQTWHNIAEPPNTGRYTWRLPPADSNQCRIRIADAADPTVADTSDRAFTIYPCPDILTVDFNLDCYVDFRDFVALSLGPDFDFLEFTALAAQWLNCANPYDPACSPRQQ